MFPSSLHLINIDVLCFLDKFLSIMISWYMLAILISYWWERSCLCVCCDRLFFSFLGLRFLFYFNVMSKNWFFFIFCSLFLQQYEPGYTAAPKKSQVADAATTIRYSRIICLFFRMIELISHAYVKFKY